MKKKTQESKMHLCHNTVLVVAILAIAALEACAILTRQDGENFLTTLSVIAALGGVPTGVAAMKKRLA